MSKQSLIRLYITPKIQYDFLQLFPMKTSLMEILWLTKDLPPTLHYAFSPGFTDKCF